jgi:hypothetical protein
MLDEWEDRVFPLNRGQVMGTLFNAWKIPEAICQPLYYTSNPFSSLTAIEEPLRTKVELLKIAIFIGQIAVGVWDCWDTVEFPSASVFRRLHIESLPKIIEDTRADTKTIIDSRKRKIVGTKTNNPKRPEPPAPSIVKLLGYCNLSSESHDFLHEVVSSMGITLVECVPNILEPSQNFLINCLWNPPQRYNSIFSAGEPYGAKLIVTDPNHAVFYRSSGNVIPMPTSYGSLYAACTKIARHADSIPQKANQTAGRF